MFATLTGLGLASAAGLNAYIPLLAVGLLARFTDLVPLGDAWLWIEHPVTLVTLAVLLVVEFAADKFPAVDSVNDVIQTVVRPTSGGIVFGAGASTVELSEITGAASGAVAGDGTGISWVPVIAGVVVALLFHVAKAMTRVVTNGVSLGCSAPLVSLAEDFVSLVTSLLAILVPLLILILFPVMVVGGVLLVRRVRRARAERHAARNQGAPDQGVPDHGHPG
ncbi:DUF4126 domain-containing protein [Nocardiopsis sp. NPDC058631]|uniref:DUF4126 domain-containing protein n=1 Tax=Nocardiopsis sp. NPDC058631 TaxID=3346566 RepID=UPI003653BA02